MNLLLKAFTSSTGMVLMLGKHENRPRASPDFYWSFIFKLYEKYQLKKSSSYTKEKDFLYELL